MKELQIDELRLRSVRLFETCETDLARKVLEIDQNAESLKQFEMLKRLVRAIDHYQAKDGNLSYVGFVGHYSSGKSSAINALLQLAHSNDKRETGPHPTDNSITLITDKSNTNLLMMMP